MSRGIPVYCGYGKRLVNVDFDDFDKTKEAVRKKWNLQGDFVLQVPDGKGEYMDIVDDDDLREFRNAESLTVHLLDGPPGAVATPNVGQTPPPSYEQSVHPASATPQPQHQPQPKPVENKMTVGVEYGTSAKRVSIFTENLQKTKQAIRQKFPAIPDDDFDLFAEISGQDDILITNNADLSQYKDADSFQVQRRVVQPSKPKPGKNVSTKSNEKRTVTHDGKSKFVAMNFESLDATKEEIRKRFNLSGDLDIQGQVPGSGKKYDIEDDTELMDFKDAEEFHVRTHPSAAYPSSPDQGRYTNRPHEPRNEPAKPIFMTQAPSKVSETKSLPVSYGGRRRSVTVELDNVAGTKRAIRQRLMIDTDFVLKAKVGTDDCRDIIDESDLKDLRVAKELVVEDLPDEAKGFSAGSQQVVPVSPVSQDPNKTQDLYLEEMGETAMITYAGTSYGLYQPPPQESRVVLDQQKHLTNTMNVTKLVDKMELTADFLRLAYFGVVGNRKLHKEIQQMQFDVAELSKECGGAAVEFKIKAGDVIENLQYGFAYLLDGDNEFALENFENIGVLSKEVVEKTKTLKANVEKKEKEIKDILAMVTKEHRGATGPGMPSDWAEQQLKSRIEKGRKDINQSYDQCRKLEGDITKSKSDIAQAAKSKKPVRDDFFRWVNQGYLYTTELDAVVTDKEKMLKNMAKEDRLKELEEMKRARENEQRANRELLQMVETMKKIDFHRNDEMVDMALRGAETGVRSLLAALKPVIAFWNNLALQCDSIANTGAAGRLKDAAKPSSTERNRVFWNRKPFKMQALNFFAKWVALRGMCQDFQTGMERVGEGIHLCIQENPSVDEAMKRMKDLLPEFDARIKKEQDALKEASNKDRSEKESIEKDQAASKEAGDQVDVTKP